MAATLLIVVCLQASPKTGYWFMGPRYLLRVYISGTEWNTNMENNTISPHTDKRLLEAEAEHKDHLIPESHAAGALTVSPRARNQQDLGVLTTAEGWQDCRTWEKRLLKMHPPPSSNFIILPFSRFLSPACVTWFIYLYEPWFPPVLVGDRKSTSLVCLRIGDDTPEAPM